MVKKTEVMIGDIICVHNRAFEITEIHKNAVEGKFLFLGPLTYNSAWAKVKPYVLTADLLETLGFKEVDGYGRNLWLYEGDNFKVHYDIAENSLSILGSPVKIMGFTFCYITTLHELIHQFKVFNLDTVDFYKRMKNA